MKLLSSLTALLAGLIAGVIPALAAADSGQLRTMLVMDASGSMWGRVDGEYKIVIARQVIADMMNDWDSDIPLGLSAYGHKSKGNCSDIETLVFPATGTSGEITHIVSKLNPKGKTPLTSAVMQAAQTLDYEQTPASVVLLSDGKETCDLDPCAMGASLEERGIDFTIYVIGFNVAVADQDGLRCLAETTGGEFLAADSSEQLQEAMGAIGEAVAAKARSVVINEVDDTPTVNLAAFMTADQPIVDEEVYWDIQAIDDNSQTGERVRSVGATLSTTLPPGRFRVHARYGGAFKYLDFQSDAEESTDVPVVFDAGRLRVRAEVSGTTPDDEVFWSAYPLEGNLEEGNRRDTVIARDAAEFVLNAGLYRIKANLDGHRPAAFDVMIQAGEVSERLLTLMPE